MMQRNAILNILLIFVVLPQINGRPSSFKENLLTKENPEQNLDLIEGDMLFPASSHTSRGVLLRGNSVAWPNGIVPYQIIESGYGDEQIQFIISTMDKMERLISVNNVVCVQFRPRISSDEYYITIRNSLGCSSYVGQNTGVTMELTVTLQYPGCLYEGIVMHELIHTLGFFHEQSRPDRDNFIRVNYSNIISGLQYNFDRYNNSFVDTQNTPYDYGSVMHYDQFAFSSNGYATIIPLQANLTIGQREMMSSIDIQEIRLFYNCSATGQTFSPSTTPVNLYTVNTTISSALTIYSSTYSRYDISDLIFYYQAFEIRVPSDGYYRFQSVSLVDTYGYLYESSFNPFAPAINLIKSDDDSGGSGQFQLRASLLSNQTYILVFTTYRELITTNFSLIVSGLTSVNITQLNYNYTLNFTTTSTSTYSQLTSRYASVLTTDSSSYSRYGSNGTFYYEAIQINVSLDGYYYIRSNSSIDAYGYLYLDSFSPNNVAENLLISDDNSAGGLQFLISYTLQSNYRYILIMTTYHSYSTTLFSISVTGPSTPAQSKINMIISTIIGLIINYILQK